jgi:Rap1a immunity proteins
MAMKKWNAVYVAAMIVAMMAVPARAEFVDGKTLSAWAQEFQRVRSGTGDYLSHIYHRRFQVYILGVHDAYTDGPGITLDDNLFCTPRNTSVNEISLIVYRYLQNTPGLPNESASGLVVNALVSAFPCKD